MNTQSHDPSRRPMQVLALALVALPAAAQDPVTMSIAGGGASHLAPDCAGNPILPASLLAPDTPDGAPALGAPAPPCIAIPHTGVGSLGLLAGNATLELDAVSFATDWRLARKPRPASVWFSVDVRGRGLPLPSIPPTLPTEAPCGDQGASVFTDTGLRGAGGAFTVGGRHALEVLDGDGLPSCTGQTGPSLGLVEPHLPGMGQIGDDLDAFDSGTQEDLVYFSLEGALPDTCGGAPGTGTAQLHGFSPSAVLVSDRTGAPPVVWITPAALGLDLAGFASDDLDALAIWDDGDKVHLSNGVPYSWNQGGGDMVLFSVRRGSTVIGQPDSRFGQPIEECDVLIPPVPGGVSPFPGILIRGEALGLRSRRTGTASSCGPNSFADDLDALDVLEKPMFDCNGNGIEDALDILRGTSTDADQNGTPDECG